MDNSRAVKALNNNSRKSMHERVKSKMARDRRCEGCGDSINHRHYHSRFCFPCVRRRERKPLAVKAHQKVALAVARGDLPPVVTLTCVDCRQFQAQAYDHRDYRYPLLVEPVCGGCNKRRGPGKPYDQVA